MSGNNSPDWYSNTRGGGGVDCSGLRRESALQAPNPDAVDALRPGDVLGLVLHDGDAPTIAAMTASGIEAGAVTPDRALIDCLRLGVAFLGTIKSAEGAQILLSIRAE
ncbi:MAG: hypothetical protein J0H56_12655 [Micrococcales bacterium]|nr:hypothetical protein [Micrococcales bacterium]